MNNKNPLVRKYTISNTLSDKYWLLVAFIIITLIFVATIQWIKLNPSATSMDEAAYINRAYSDATAFHQRGLRGLGRSILLKDRNRPPGYRLMVLPATLAWDNFPTSLLRGFSLGFLILSLIFVYQASRHISGPTAGAFSVIFLALSPVVLSANRSFGTEYPLIFAITAMYYFIFKVWGKQYYQWHDWTGLGIALGIGGLSKLTFVMIAGPVLFLAMFFCIKNKLPGPPLKFFMKAIALGIVITLPWWLLNYQYALEYAAFASSFTRHSLADSIWDKLLIMPALYMTQAIGPALTLLLFLALLSILFKRFYKSDLPLNPRQTSALWICLAGIMPLLILHLIGDNQNMRFIIVPIIPFFLGAGILIAQIRFRQKPSLIALASLLLLYQLFQILVSFNLDPDKAQAIAEKRGYFGSGPAEVMAHSESAQWNWEPLYKIAQSNNLNKPTIVYLGNGSAYTGPHLKHPWIKRGERARTKWLWRYDKGVIDWNEINEEILKSDIVITAPNFKGNPLDKQDLDNQHNSELVERMRSNGYFKEPVKIHIGNRKAVEFLVYVRKILP